MKATMAADVHPVLIILVVLIYCIIFTRSSCCDDHGKKSPH